MIVQDLGVFSFIRRNFPDLDIHASTQMTVTGPEGMKFLEEKGATRVVPARELSLEEIAVMHEASPLEIETFIHGALCYSYSEQYFWREKRQQRPVCTALQASIQCNL